MRALPIVMTVLLSMVSLGWAHAGDMATRINFNIPSGPMASALAEFARQSDIRLVYVSSLTRDLRAPTVSGHQNPAEALAKLLKGSGLAFDAVDDSTVIIRERNEADGAPEPESEDRGRHPPIVEIATTGSRITRRDIRDTSPRTVVSNDGFFAFGNTTYDELLNTLPQAIPDATANTNNTGPNDGSMSVDLRNLGNNRVLLLLNGHRMPAANGTGRPDLNFIPPSMIGQIEIVTGGGSSVYGSDAISGVVNFKLRDRFDGLEVRASGGLSSRGDAEEAYGGMIYGTPFANDRGHIVLSADAAHKGSFTEWDRAISRFDYDVEDGMLVPDPSSSIPGGRANDVGDGVTLSPASLSPEVADYLTATFGLTSDGNIALSEDIRFGTDGNPQPYISAENTFFTTPYVYLQDPLKKLNTAGILTYDISDKARLFASLAYMHSAQRRSLSPEGLRDLRIPRSNPYITDAFRAILDAGDAAEDGNFFSYRMRILEGGARRRHNTHDAWRATISIDGSDLLGLDWSVFLNTGGSRWRELELGSYSYSRLQGALGCPANDVTSEQIDDYVPLACLDVPVFPDGISINPFGEGNITADEIRYLQMDTPIRNLTKSRQFVVGGHVSGNGPRLFADAAAYSIGTEYRRESTDFLADARLSSADVLGSSSETSFSGTYDVVETYAELALPLIRGSTIRDLTAKAGGRMSEYSSIGTVISWRFGLVASVGTWLELRGDYQRANRAPNLTELYAGRVLDYPDMRDPCALAGGADAAFCADLGAADPSVLRSGEFQVPSFAQGNPNLAAERSHTWSAGLTLYMPGQRDTRLTVDFFDIKVDNAINQISPTLLAALCLDSRDTQGSFCTRVVREDSGRVSHIENGYENVAYIRSQGVDFSLRHQLDLQDGTLNLSLLGTWLARQDRRLTAISDIVECAGYVDRGICGRAIPRWKLKGQLAWYGSRYDIALRWRYISRITDGALRDTPDASLTFPYVSDQNYVDLSARYDMGDRWQLTIGVNNMFDNKPPFIESNIGAGTDPATYGVRGRFFFLGASYRY
ncbi:MULTISPECIES: TonB-dependent receptor [Kordiimonas]|jgi:outer membrane receptor protein involved in Fe transport|uniref:TonB-dependent receptor n=1 Tax=Kordiimonas TaxID=288021 RepID=UPI00257D60C7|nr:TonB-dependent receptor [Kordiimonas sp. UBA4487]